MLKKIYFITGNKNKFQTALVAFKDSGFELLQKTIDTPEIQSDDLGKIASFSAKFAANILKHPIFLTDAGCFIESLNGFPGPFIKYVNQYLTAQDFLRLMTGKNNRKVFFKECLAYCEPGQNPVLFFSSAEGKISIKSGKQGQTSINEIFIPKGLNHPESEIPRKQMIQFWNNNINNVSLLIEYLKNNQQNHH
ncbi:MAG: non-canonical purine NTP pyrophosphatase [Patescibacteria group bacterium]